MTINIEPIKEYCHYCNEEVKDTEEKYYITGWDDSKLIEYDYLPVHWSCYVQKHQRKPLLP